MTTVLLVVHLLISLALVGVILLQRSEGGALGIGGGGGGGGGGMFGGLMTGRGSANLLTRTTAILAVCFIVMSMLLAILASREAPRSVFDAPPPLPVEEAIPDTTPPPPAAPAAPVAD